MGFMSMGLVIIVLLVVLGLGLVFGLVKKDKWL